MATNSDSTRPMATVEVADYVGKQIGMEAADGLHAYSVYPGEVTSVDYTTRTLSVAIQGEEVTGCVYVAGGLASLFGVSDTALPPVGAPVICVYTPGTTYVIGIQPRYMPVTSTYSVSASGSEEQAADLFPHIQAEAEGGYAAYAGGYPQPNDVMPGESDRSNNIGMAIRLLSNLAQLDAGGLAVVEACLANDMVRIVDQTFAHHSCGGDHFIWNNGRCNEEEHFTSYPHEAAGKLKEDDPYADETDTGVYKLKEEDNAIDSTGRWRLSTYKGFLGDMLHFWVTHPTEVVSNYAESAARAGRFHTWVGADGTLVVQAAGDVLIDVNPHIVIPAVLHKWDNPEWKPEEMLKNLDKEYLKIWGKGDSRWHDLNASVWQMRQYLKYLTIWHSLARFRQVSTDKSKLCEIPTEEKAPLGNPDCDEMDRKKAGCTSKEPAAARATLRMSPDGSITMMAMPASPAATGISSFIMNNGSIQVVAPHDLEIKCGGTFSVTAGNVSLKAFKLVEIVSLCGTLVTKARTAWKALCERGRLWLKSDMSKSKPGEVDNSMPQEFEEYSVIVDAADGKTLVHGHEGAVVGADGPQAKVRLESIGGAGEVGIYGHHINMMAKDELKHKSKRFSAVSEAAGFDAKQIKVTDNIRILPGFVDVDSNIRCGQVICADVFSKGGYIGPTGEVRVYDTDNPPENIDPETEAEEADKLIERTEKLKEEDVVEDYPKLEFKGQSSNWQLYSWESYTSVSDPSALKADPWFDDAVTVDGMRPEDKKQNKSYSVKFLWSQARLRNGTRTSVSEFPWPGRNAALVAFSDKKSQKSVWETLDEDFKAEDIKDASKMVPRPLIYLFK